MSRNRNWALFLIINLDTDSSPVINVNAYDHTCKCSKWEVFLRPAILQEFFFMSFTEAKFSFFRNNVSFMQVVMSLCWVLSTLWSDIHVLFLANYFRHIHLFALFLFSSRLQPPINPSLVPIPPRGHTFTSSLHPHPKPPSAPLSPSPPQVWCRYTKSDSSGPARRPIPVRHSRVSPLFFGPILFHGPRAIGPLPSLSISPNP